jgi:hypothetical protein
MLRLLAVVSVVVVACGPSGKEVQTARAAHYRTEAGRIYSIALDTAEETFKIYDKDDDKELFMTLPKWYTADGQSQTRGSGDTVMVNDGSLLVSLLVAVETDVDGVTTVTVTPVVERYRLGQAQDDKLAPDDPSLPGWVHGKADALAVDIYNAAKKYAQP